MGDPKPLSAANNEIVKNPTFESISMVVGIRPPPRKAPVQRCSSDYQHSASKYSDVGHIPVQVLQGLSALYFYLKGVAMQSKPYAMMDDFFAFLIHSRPKSILDISLGYAKMGFVARDPSVQDGSPEKCQPIRLETIVSAAPDLQDHLRPIYDNIHVGNIDHTIEKLGVYDMVVVDGILEQLTKEDGLSFLYKCMQHSSQDVAVFLTIEKNEPSKWKETDLEPLSHLHRIQSNGENTHAAFLLSKKAFIDHQIEILKSAAFHPTATKVPSIRQRYGLDHKQVGGIDLSRFNEQVINAEHRNYFFDTDFKEHYRLIAYLSTLFQGETIFDIGTNLGYSSLALSYEPNNLVISYDLVECKQLGNPKKLKNIEYCLGDVRDDPRLLQSPLIMLDTNHDGKFEYEFYNFLKNHQYKGLLFLDDIHLNSAMEQFWASIVESKDDVTDLGHWSGSGIVVFR